ncbi:MULTISPECIES: lactate/malate family dehydrogenase [Macrococcus]
MKLGIIGTGRVGSQILTDIQYLNLFTDIILIDTNQNVAEGEALDHRHAQGLSTTNHINVKSGSYDDLKDASVIVVTASAPMNPNMPDRTALTKNNISVVECIMTQISKVTKEAIIILVTNPVDAMTYLASQTEGYPRHKIIGTGTLLETARFKTLIADHYNIDPKSVEAFVIGEHGQHAVPVWSKVSIAGMTLDEFEGISGKERIDKDFIGEQIDQVSFNVLRNKGWTNAAISKSTVEIIRSIVLNEKSIFPLTSLNQKEQVAISLPTLINDEGIVQVYDIHLSDDEQKRFNNAKNFIKKTVHIKYEL